MINETLLETERKKKYLKRYRKNTAMISRLNAKLEDLNQRIYTVKAPSLSGLPRGGDPVTLADLVADKTDLEERIDRLKDKGRGIRREILSKIDDLDDTRYAEILEAFCIECKDFEEIADETGYNVRHVIRLYSEGIGAIVIADRQQ